MTFKSAILNIFNLWEKINLLFSQDLNFNSNGIIKISDPVATLSSLSGNKEKVFFNKIKQFLSISHQDFEHKTIQIATRSRPKVFKIANCNVSVSLAKAEGSLQKE